MHGVLVNVDARGRKKFAGSARQRGIRSAVRNVRYRRVLAAQELRLALTLLLVMPAVMPATGGEGDPTGAEPSQDTERFVVVDGQITDPIGGGQRGAVVVVRWKGKGETEGDIIGTATTDAYGDFAVASAEAVRGDIVVTVSKPRFANLIREFHIGDDEFPPYLAESLAGDVRFTGRVIDALTKEPVAGAAIRLSTMEQGWNSESDDHGKFTFEGVTPGSGTLVATASGYGRERRDVEQLEVSSEIVVELEREQVVRLTVVDDLARPIAGVNVECYDRDHDDFRMGVTDKSGVVVLDGFHAATDSLEVRLIHDEHVSDADFDRRVVMPPEKAESMHLLVMERAGKVSGLVTDAATGDLLNGARVMTGPTYSDSSPRDWSSYLGQYSISGIRPGVTVITVHLSGHAPELTTVEVRAGETTKLDVKLTAPAVLTGVVKSESGDPFPGAAVNAVEWRGYTTLGLRAMADADGRFVIENAPQDEFEIKVRARGTAWVTRMVKAGQETPIEITLSGDLGETTLLSAGKVKVGEAAPVLEMTSLDGETIDFAKLEGTTILLDFWATWCAPCVAELPYLVELQQKLGGRKDFVIVSVSLDDDEKELRDFVKKRKLTWHQVFGEAGGADKAVDEYGVVAVPAVFLIDVEGKVAATNLAGSGIVAAVEKMLNKPESP